MVVVKPIVEDAAESNLLVTTVKGEQASFILRSRGARRPFKVSAPLTVGQAPIKPSDPYVLPHVATILIDCGFRPEECFRLEWADVRDGAIEIRFGKTEGARRRIPLPPRAVAILEERRKTRAGEWVFPARTHSRHIEPGSLKRQHRAACMAAGLEPLPIYTCLTR